MNPGRGLDGPESGYVGDCDQDADARMECRICGSLYDPAEGDPTGEIPPGTAFGALPKGWCCPRCDSAKSYFLAIS